MRCVIGYNADEAVKILEQEGFRCRVREYAARRPCGEDRRVVAQTVVEDDIVLLTVCAFRTEADPG